MGYIWTQQPHLNHIGKVTITAVPYAAQTSADKHFPKSRMQCLVKDALSLVETLSMEGQYQPHQDERRAA